MAAPRTSMKTKLSYADTRTGVKTDIGYAQEIPPLKVAPEAISYGGLDLEAEQQAPGIAKAEELVIPVLYTEEQHDKLIALEEAGKEVYWFVQLPAETATSPGKPLTWNFKATVFVSNDTLTIDGMIQENITLYKSSAVEETKGYPEE